VVDDVLERADLALTAAADLRAQATALPSAVRNAGPRRAIGAAVAGGGGAARGLQRYNAALRRPQDAFTQPVDNSNTPFVPHPPRRSDAAAAAAAAAASDDGGHAHPYAAELEALSYEPWQLEAAEPTPAGDLDSTPVTWVDTPAALQAMVEVLRGAKEVAVDLEHHSYRYSGLRRSGSRSLCRCLLVP